MADLIGRKPIKLYQAKVIRMDDVEEQREFAKFWKCKTFELSDRAKEIFKFIENLEEKQ